MKKGLFVELTYTGRTKDGVFDTTDKAVAQAEGLTQDFAYKPVITCLGQGFVLLALEEFLIGKELNKQYTVTLPAEQAFGKKDAKKIQLVSQTKFTKQDIQPYPGLQVDVDGNMALIRRVSGGRVLVDFNHPLAGQEVTYDVTVLREVTDTKEKVTALLNRSFGNVPFTLENNELVLEAALPKELEEPITKQIQAVIPEIAKVSFKAPNAEKSPSKEEKQEAPADEKKAEDQPKNL